MNTLTKNLIHWIEQSNEKVMIGISGHGAAGKTTFAMKLIKDVNVAVNYLNTDPYIVSSEIRKYTTMDYVYAETVHRAKITACHPAAHNILALERDILMLKEGMDICTIDTHYLKSELLQAQHKVSIVEGMSVAFTNPALFDVLLYFYTDDDTELDRRFCRDIEERGTNRAYLEQTHKERRIQYELFMHPYSEQFDVIVKSIGAESVIEKNKLNFKLNERFD